MSENLAETTNVNEKLKCDEDRFNFLLVCNLILSHVGKAPVEDIY